MDLWLVTCPDDFAGEYDDIEEMFKRGLTHLILDKQSRIKPTKKEEFANATIDEYERWLLGLPLELRKSIWVRGLPNYVKQLDVRGCVCDCKFFLENNLDLSESTDCIALCSSLDEILALPKHINTALLGPLFQPISVYKPVKTLLDDSFFESNFANAIQNAKPKNLIAWGGIEPETILQIKKMPFDGVACLGGIWNYADPINAFIKLRREINGFL